jgi:hypothetical protein
MIIGNKDIWQFGRQYIDIRTGKSATRCEIKTFLQEMKKQKAIREEWQRAEAEERKQWHAEYDPLIRKFFDFADNEVCPHFHDDDDLCYALATFFYDNSDIKPPFDPEPDALNEVKETFPKHWERALEMYRNGEHDT